MDEVSELGQYNRMCTHHWVRSERMKGESEKDLVQPLVLPFTKMDNM